MNRPRHSWLSPEGRWRWDGDSDCLGILYVRPMNEEGTILYCIPNVQLLVAPALISALDLFLPWELQPSHNNYNI